MTDAFCCCKRVTNTSWFRDLFTICQKIVHLRQLEGVSFVNRRYTKGEPFLSKMVCKRIRGGWGGAGRLEDPLRITLC